MFSIDKIVKFNELDDFNFWHEIGTIPHKIGTVLLFLRKKGYVTLNMLKTAPKSNPGWHGIFPERCFFFALLTA